MRFFAFEANGVRGLGLEAQGGFKGLLATDAAYPGDLLSLIRQGSGALASAGATLQAGRAIDPHAIAYLPPVATPEKIVCVGLNYHDHSAESGFETPSYPTLFGRFNSSLIGHGAPILRPELSVQLDYEGELAAIIGSQARNVSETDALDHVAGYSVAKLVSMLSQFMTLNPGDVIVTGTPSGVGLARKPPLFMKDGDVCEVEIEGIGVLRNPIVDEAAAVTASAA